MIMKSVGSCVGAFLRNGSMNGEGAASAWCDCDSRVCFHKGNMFSLQ